jgi:hypothetical protein
LFVRPALVAERLLDNGDRLRRSGGPRCQFLEGGGIPENNECAVASPREAPPMSKIWPPVAVTERRLRGRSGVLGPVLSWELGDSTPQNGRATRRVGGGSCLRFPRPLRKPRDHSLRVLGHRAGGIGPRKRCRLGISIRPESGSLGEVATARKIRCVAVLPAGPCVVQRATGGSIATVIAWRLTLSN